MSPNQTNEMKKNGTFITAGTVAAAAANDVSAELRASLQEEQELLEEQMGLLQKLETIKASIVAAEAEIKLANLATRQAAVIRMRSEAEGRGGKNDEMIVIDVGAK